VWVWHACQNQGKVGLTGLLNSRHLDLTISQVQGRPKALGLGSAPSPSYGTHGTPETLGLGRAPSLK